MVLIAVRQDDNDDLLRRYRWFGEEAERALQYDPLRAAGVRLNRAALWQAARVHFLIMDAYKADHFSGGRTEDAKIAAITAMAIVAMKPLRVIDPDNVVSPWAARANEHLATRLAGPILNSGLPELAEGDRTAWLLNFLSRMEARCLKKFIDDARTAQFDEFYDISLDNEPARRPRDLSQLQALMLIYHLLWRPVPKLAAENMR